jgi:hypothetical protein
MQLITEWAAWAGHAVNGGDEPPLEKTNPARRGRAVTGRMGSKKRTQGAATEKFERANPITALCLLASGIQARSIPVVFFSATRAMRAG